MTGQAPIIVMPMVVHVGKATDEEKAFALEAIKAMGESIAANLLTALAALPAAAAGSTRTRAISAVPNTELEWINAKPNREIAREWLLGEGVDEKGKPYVAKSGAISGRALGFFKQFWPDLVGQDLSQVKAAANAEAASE